MMMTSPTVDTDIVILGGGLVGLTMACALSVETGLNIILIDQRPPPSIELSSVYDLRVSAINHASKAILQYCGVWEALSSLRISPYQSMQVWDEKSPARIYFEATEIGQRYLGYIIEHSVLQQVLWNRLQEAKNIKILFDTKPLALSEENDFIAIQLSTGENLTCRLLIGADGGNSWVAQQAKLPVNQKDYGQHALVATVRLEQPHQCRAWQRFLSTGPIAFLPLADSHLVSIVWSTTQANASELQQMEEGEFNRILSRAIEFTFGTVAVQSPRVIFPLVQRHTRNYVKNRLALIGDAAHSIHPLAGQGVNLGLLDVACLAEVIAKTNKAGRDIGNLSCLRRYERWRKGENVAMLLAMQGFKQWFASQSFMAVQTRYWGFHLTDKLPLLKQFFMQRAMGLQGDLPKAAKASF